jgi:hypothetical protein
MAQPKISLVSTLGPALSICGYCRKIVGKTTVLLSLTNNHQENKELPEILNESTQYCQCIEKMLLGARYE